MQTEAELRGRPQITAELLKQVLERVAEGESIRQICADEAMPAASTVYLKAASDPEFSEQYARAREAQMDRFAEEILEIADDGSNDYIEKQNKDGSKHEAFDAEHVQRSRLRVDSRKWLMSKLAPKKYGEKVTLGGDAENPIRIEAVRREIVRPNSNNPDR